MKYLIEIDSVEIETATPAEAAQQATKFLREYPSEVRLTVVRYDPDEHGPLEALE